MGEKSEILEIFEPTEVGEEVLELVSGGKFPAIDPNG